MTTMKLSRYFMPGEWYPHRRCWMLWPYRRDNWNHNAIPAQKAFLQVAMAIARFEDVMIGVPARFRQLATEMLSEATKSSQEPKFSIDLFEVESNDAWMRDVGPTFVIPKESKDSAPLLGIDWIFNAWGQKYSNWSADDAIAQQVIQLTGCPTDSFRADFVLEGGSIHVDGEGTVLTTEECLLNPNRNPHLSKTEIEERLKLYLGVEKVIWLPLGLAADEDTNGHIDNIACFTRPGQVLLSWTDDPNDEHYPRCQAALQVLQSTTDAKNRPIDVVKIPIPPTMYYTEEDMATLVSESSTVGEEYDRMVGRRLAGSYVNFYIANQGIVSASLHPATDSIARTILESCFPGYEVVQVPGREILLGGGNIHCITQQQPLK